MMHEIGRQASMVAYVDAYWLLFLMTVSVIPLCLFLRSPKRTAHTESLPIVE